jgi:hypothetical protein
MTIFSTDIFLLTIWVSQTYDYLILSDILDFLGLEKRIFEVLFFLFDVFYSRGSLFKNWFKIFKDLLLGTFYYKIERVFFYLEGPIYLFK